MNLFRLSISKVFYFFKHKDTKIERQKEESFINDKKQDR